MPAAASGCPSAPTDSSLAVPIGKSKLTQALREQVQQAASSSSPVLLIGEFGSGREAYARYLHSLSARSAKPFFMVVAASLGADPAAALFGSERDGKVDAGRLRPGGGRLAVPERARGSDTARRSARCSARSSKTATRGLAAASGCPSTCAGSARRRRASSRAPSPEPFRRDLIAHLNVITLARAAAARVCGGRAGPAALLRGSPGRRSASAAAPLQRRRAEPPAQLSLARQSRTSSRIWCSGC